MWLFTGTGFVSAVRHYDDPRILIVRARDELSLASLSEAAETSISATPDNDYPFRTMVSKDIFAEWVLQQVSNLNYTNYKAHMCSERPEFGGALHDVWAMMHAVESRRDLGPDRERAAVLYPGQDWTDEDMEMLKGLGHI